MLDFETQKDEIIACICRGLMNTPFFFCKQLHGHPWFFDDSFLYNLSMIPNDVHFHALLKRLSFIWLYIP